MKKVAYLILAHSDPLQLDKLCTALDCEYNDLYIHIDAKQTSLDVFREAAGASVCFLEQRVSVSWGGITMIDALNLLIKQALLKKNEYTHLVFISGSCYPIKNVKSIHETLVQSPTYEFVKYIDMRESPEHYLKQITKKWFNEPVIKFSQPGSSHLLSPYFLEKAARALLNKLKLKNQWNENMVPYYGSTWCALTTDCCQYIMDFQDENPWYREMNKYTFAPDEHFYHTIIGNSEFAASSTGAQPFAGRGLWRLANFHIIDESLSKWFTVDDWEAVASSDKFFVRKVRSLDGTELVDQINRELLI
ncbi:MAG: hypothetical protein CML06_05855 [Pseudomonadales bacterium]|nr:hypothetical protein [Pseudomonadales bacterium]